MSLYSLTIDPHTHEEYANMYNGATVFIFSKKECAIESALNFAAEIAQLPLETSLSAISAYRGTEFIIRADDNFIEITRKLPDQGWYKWFSLTVTYHSIIYDQAIFSNTVSASETL